MKRMECLRVNQSNSELYHRYPAPRKNVWSGIRSTFESANHMITTGIPHLGAIKPNSSPSSWGPDYHRNPTWWFSSNPSIWLTVYTEITEVINTTAWQNTHRTLEENWTKTDLTSFNSLQYKPVQHIWRVCSAFLLVHLTNRLRPSVRRGTFDHQRPWKTTFYVDL